MSLERLLAAVDAILHVLENMPPTLRSYPKMAPLVAELREARRAGYGSLDELLSAAGEMVRIADSTFMFGISGVSVRLRRAMVAFDAPIKKDEADDPLTELVLNEARQSISNDPCSPPPLTDNGTSNGTPIVLTDVLMRAVTKPRNWTSGLRKRVDMIMLAAGWIPCVHDLYQEGKSINSAWKPPVKP